MRRGNRPKRKQELEPCERRTPLDKHTLRLLEVGAHRVDLVDDVLHSVDAEPRYIGVAVEASQIATINKKGQHPKQTYQFQLASLLTNPEACPHTTNAQIDLLLPPKRMQEPVLNHMNQRVLAPFGEVTKKNGTLIQATYVWHSHVKLPVSKGNGENPKRVGPLQFPFQPTAPEAYPRKNNARMGTGCRIGEPTKMWFSWVSL